MPLPSVPDFLPRLPQMPESLSHTHNSKVHLLREFPLLRRISYAWSIYRGGIHRCPSPADHHAQGSTYESSRLPP